MRNSVVDESEMSFRSSDPAIDRVGRSESDALGLKVDRNLIENEIRIGRTHR
jgi:hypothetical protein